ncbi:MULTISPECIES: TlyA family RNA methyltransferase [unclassified Halomonas]|uniref:TlyA family RNA methyltransferase n=1 Tax=unclassified Halomonas TaxID=2609666 RepID=UPI0007DA1517|nr:MULTISPECIES: TlyA family RNA methyltransferase [unclassified Halomonas]MBT2788749.1 TlyA family RNA methyltransferase [Halomonas sp. ISL-106]MBT2799468.1 TlyA family RNA methyltransferase [Halomonas sp. ISL-104]OAL60385.1 hemolysin [Halomonas sp. ALS9]
MMRLDQLLVSQGLANSRTRAQRLIRHGRISLADNGKPLIKASEKWPEDTRFAVEDDPEERYVSRAGLKLEAVLTTLELRFDGCVVLDIGQSTGGFSDCALRFGARHVIGVEVGHGQLASELRDDPRVTCLEGLNARSMSSSEVLNRVLSVQPIDSAIMDVSFISQTLILPEIAALLPLGGELISLVKPQFELSPDALNKRGVVRDTKHFSAVEANIRSACGVCGLTIRHWQESPITGSDGNREFLLHAIKEA